MEDLRETLDDLRDADEVRERTTKVRITILILVITILGTLAAVLASLADAHAATTQRQQQVQALTAQQDQDAAAGSLFANTESKNQSQLDFQNDAAWWVEGLTVSPRVEQAMRTAWLNRSNDWRKAISGSSSRYWNMFNASTRNGELAVVDGATVSAWREKEDGYITGAAIFAVSLFLVGLVLTTHQQSSRRILVIASALLTLFACIRVVQTHVQKVPGIDPAVLTAYTKGEQELNQGDGPSAVKYFKHVVAERPQTPEAWLGLATALDEQPFPSRSRLSMAVSAYHHVIAGGEGSSEVENNLAFDELRLGQLRSARADTRLALKTHNAADWSYAESTRAEINMVSGNSAAALSYLTAAADRVGQLDTQTIDTFFVSLRDDRAYFSSVGVPRSRWQPFYGSAESMEASLDAIYSVEPGPRGNAAISDLNAKYYDLANFGRTSSEGLVYLHFDYRGFSKSGVFSLRTYSDVDGQYQLLAMSSATRTDQWSWGNGRGSFNSYVPLSVSRGYTYNVELYWNGNMLASAQVNI